MVFFDAAPFFGWALVCSALALLQFFTGLGLWRLESWARWIAAVLIAVGLLEFPMGTLICGIFLYILLNKQCAMVFSDEYKRVIEATPQMSCDTSIFVGVFFVLLAFWICTNLLGII